VDSLKLYVLLHDEESIVFVDENDQDKVNKNDVDIGVNVNVNVDVNDANKKG
jgi:hypothetical protein